MVRSYSAPVRVYKHPFEFVMAAYERRFPVCPLVPQLLATDVLWEEKSDGGAHHIVERRCTVEFEAPYILRKITGQEVMYFIQRNELDWKTQTLDIYTYNETFSSRIAINERCKYYVHPKKPQWTCFNQSASLEVKNFWGFEGLAEGLGVRLYSGSLQKGKEIMEHFISELHSEGVFHVPQWGAEKEEEEEEQVCLPRCGNEQVTRLFVSQLTEEEAGALGELREQVVAVLKAWMVPDDDVLLRFLKAREFNAEKARLMLMHSLAWRHQHCLSQLAKWVPPPLLTQHFPGGWTHTDREGHPVFIVLLGAMDVKGLLKAVGEPALMKYLLQLLEEGVKQTVESTRQWGKPISSCTVVCDLEGLCVDHLRRPGVSVLGRFLRLVTEHYPGVLTKLLIVRCPPWGPAPSPFLLGADTVAVFSGEQHKGPTGLQNHIPPEHIPDFLGGGLQVTEIVYVHSKCMIVDDRLTIIGSANVNDRSMLGDRDSEVAILVEDNDKIDGRMNGEPYKVGKFSHSLRCHIFKEHLGLLDERTRLKDIDVQDPVCDEFYHTWMKSAERNIDLFDEVFGGKNLPYDKILNYQHLKSHKEKPGIVDLEKAKELLAQIQGTIVPMPLRFLEEENLLPDFGTKESFAPDILVT